MSPARSLSPVLALLGVLALPGAAHAAPLTLDEALAMAARKNADLLSARADLDAARADVASARAAILPRLDLQASVGRQWWGDGVTTTSGVTVPVRAGA